MVVFGLFFTVSPVCAHALSPSATMTMRVIVLRVVSDINSSLIDAAYPARGHQRTRTSTRRLRLRPCADSLGSSGKFDEKPAG